MYIDYLTLNWDKIDEGSYLRKIPAVRSLKRLPFQKPFTFFVGENGSGKSTLLEAIAISFGFNPEGGSYNYRFSTYDDYSDLAKATTLGKGMAGPKGGFFLRAESFYNVSTQTIEYEKYDGPMYGDKTLHEMSHGESFLNFILTHSRQGLFLMDEPEAALSPNRQLTLFSRMVQMAGKGSQYIIVTHSPILLAIPDADIYGFDDNGIHRLEYEETDSYHVTEMFINHRDLMVRNLLG